MRPKITSMRFILEYLRSQGENLINTVYKMNTIGILFFYFPSKKCTITKVETQEKAPILKFGRDPFQDKKIRQNAEEISTTLNERSATFGGRNIGKDEVIPKNLTVDKSFYSPDRLNTIPKHIEPALSSNHKCNEGPQLSSPPAQY